MTLNSLPHQNGLLAALPSDVVARLEPHLEPVPLSLGKVLYEAGGTARHVYFPVECVVSMLYTMRNGASVEIAKIGHEGLIGLSLFMSGQRPPSRAVVQSAGAAYRILGSRLKLEFDRHADLMALMLRYTQALITQMIQTAACNRHHSVEQQLCRWLLLTLDRLPAQELVMTQELVASMLGVRREGITQAAGNLQQAGLIRYRRGHIAVLERSGLEARACECYAVVKKELDRLLSDVQHRHGLSAVAA